MNARVMKCRVEYRGVVLSRHENISDARSALRGQPSGTQIFRESDNAELALNRPYGGSAQSLVDGLQRERATQKGAA